MFVVAAWCARPHGRARVSRSIDTPKTDTPAMTRLYALLALFICASLLAIAAPSSVMGAPNLPDLTGQIVDNAGLLTPEDRADLLAQLQTLEQTSTDQIAIATVPTLDGYTIEDYSIALARKWQLGQKGKDNGILLLVAPKERKVRIEVGRRLEPLMTDTMSKIIIQNAILPKFRRGDYSGGIKDGVRDIKDVLLGDADAVKNRARGQPSLENDPSFLIYLFIWCAIVLFAIWLNSRSQYQVPENMSAADRKRARRRRDGGPFIFIPGGSGGWSGGSGGGGGWSGGGGSFGGGGASGDW